VGQKKQLNKLFFQSLMVHNLVSTGKLSDNFPIDLVKKSFSKTKVFPLEAKLGFAHNNNYNF